MFIAAKAFVLTNLETNTPSTITYNDTKNNIIIVGIANFIKVKNLKFCANLFSISTDNTKNKTEKETDNFLLPVSFLCSKKLVIKN